ncbi:MAG: YncE family protein [Desulfobacteraceae bacterium]
MQPFRCAIILLITCVFLAACLPQEMPSNSGRPLSRNGEMVLFLQPLPQETLGLTFTIDQAKVLHSDGGETIIPLLFGRVDASAHQNIQRKMAAVILSPGLYDGIALEIKTAAIATDKGPMALLAPDETLLVKQPFEIRPGRASALFLSMGLSDADRQSIRFVPQFSLSPPPKGIVNLTGYITDAKANTLTVLNKQDMRIVDVIATAQGPADLAIDSLRRRAYVSAADDNQIEVIDLMKREKIESLRLFMNDRPVALALTPDGRTLVTANHGSNTVSLIDALAMVEISRISVGEGPTAVVITPSGLKAAILNTRASTVSIIDLPQKTLAVTIGLEGEPVDAVVNRDSSRLFVISQNAPNLSIVDLNGLTVTHKVFVGAGGACIAADDQTDLIYVGLAGVPEIAVIDPFALTLIDTFYPGGHPAFMVIESEERHLFVTLPEQKALKKINLISKRTGAGIVVGQGAHTVAFLDER